LPIERTGDPDRAMELFVECTGRQYWPAQQFETFVVIGGQRAGKSRIASLIASDLSCLRDYSLYLAPGERGYLPVIAADRKQARVVFSYIEAFVNGCTVFKSLLADEPLKERISFSNAIDIEIMTASFRTTRGYTVVGSVLDEVAYYRSEDTATPDHEIVSAVRRGTLTIPNAMLVMISSPYARRGVLWEIYRDSWAKEDSRTLVWNAPTWVMNPTITREDLQPEFDRDFNKAMADYGGIFRKDVERFVAIETIQACVKGWEEQLPRGDINYVGFVDPSGGSQDSFTLAVGHREEDNIIVDALREWIPPFSPDTVVQEAAALLKSYGIYEVYGDKYGGSWPSERFAAHEIVYEPTKKSKSDLYRDMLPLLNAHRLHLNSNARLAKQLWELERRTTGAGKDSIDHPPGGHDDLPNAVAGMADELHSMTPLPLTW
jgi:hypothetical protein